MSDKIFEALKEAFPEKDTSTLRGLASKISSAQIDEAAEKRSSSFREGVKQRAIKSVADLAKALSDVALNTRDLEGPMSAFLTQISSVREQSEMLVQSGLNKTMFDFSRVIESVGDQSYKMTGNFRAQRRVMSAFTRDFQALGFVGESFRETLLNTGVALDTIGFSMEDFAQIIDSATMAFNMSEGQISDLSATLIKTSREFAIAPRELTENFQFAQKNFAYTSGRFMDNFLQLQKMSRMTGVGFQQLAQSFGENMDTFEGSAQMAGRLNQILGRSMFNSIDLLNKTEAERAQVIREGIIQRFGGRIGELQKFELKAIGASLNMSVEETRRFLRGEPPKAAGDMAELQKKTPAEMQAARLGTELERVSETADSFRTSLERAVISSNSALQELTKASMGYTGELYKAMQQLTETQILGMEQIGTTRGGGFADFDQSERAILAAVRSLGGEVLKEFATVLPGNLLKGVGDAASELGAITIGRKIVEMRRGGELPKIVEAKLKEFNILKGDPPQLGVDYGVPTPQQPEARRQQPGQTRADSPGPAAPRQQQASNINLSVPNMVINVTDASGQMMAQFKGRVAPDTFPSPGSMPA